MTPKRLFYVLLAVSSLLIIAGGAAYYMSHRQLTSKIDASNQLAAEIILERGRMEQLISLNDQYEELAELSEKTERILPDDKLQSEVTAQLFALIDQSGLKSSGINYESTSGKPGGRSQTNTSQTEDVLVMPATFQVTGSYSQLLQFLHNVERNERIMQVNSLDIGRLENEELSFRIGVEVFLQS